VRGGEGSKVPAAAPDVFRPQVKFCGMTRPDDARLAGRLGADLVGAVLVEGSSRFVDPATAAEVGRASGLPLVLVVVDLPVERLVELAERTGAWGIQLHGDEPPELLAELRAQGDWELWKAARVRTAEEIRVAARRYHEVADLLLLDAWHPTLKGGTGHPFPWEALEVFRSGRAPDLRVGVAGGLDPTNVGEAIRRLRPHLVDVSSGVEAVGRPGEKDPERMKDFLAAVREAAEGRDAGLGEGRRDTRTTGES
jgi:phosphoribosylanthranilate isomerase